MTVYHCRWHRVNQLEPVLRLPGQTLCLILCTEIYLPIVYESLITAQLLMNQCVELIPSKILLKAFALNVPVCFVHSTAEIAADSRRCAGGETISVRLEPLSMALVTGASCREVEAGNSPSVAV